MTYRWTHKLLVVVFVLIVPTAIAIHSPSIGLVVQPILFCLLHQFHPLGPGSTLKWKFAAAMISSSALGVLLSTLVITYYATNTSELPTLLTIKFIGRDFDVDLKAVPIVLFGLTLSAVAVLVDQPSPTYPGPRNAGKFAWASFGLVGWLILANVTKYGAFGPSRHSWIEFLGAHTMLSLVVFAGYFIHVASQRAK